MSRYFEPTFTFMGFQNRSSDVRPPFAVEGRRAVEVTHLALLGVKIAETAFWVYCKEKQPFYGCFLSETGFLFTEGSEWEAFGIE